MSFYQILLFSFLLMCSMFGKGTGRPARGHKIASADKPIVKDKTTALNMAKTSSLNNSRVNSSTGCLECAQLQLAETTLKPSIIIAESICAFCQTYQDDLKIECMQKHCAHG